MKELMLPSLQFYSGIICFYLPEFCPTAPFFKKRLNSAMHLSAIQWHQKLEFNQKYRQLFGISGRTASRELKILVEKGLIRRPEKKGAAYALE
jgi:hypothetical protein